ncbi:hypothetical protein [Oceanobacillus sp. Castelsardo]|uniref:hypothetical protein n=1 Tax=Oceanobacillus sp. Castelsardo TaxID=1851204 RepID=UPI00083801A6|nr:hypothetical protein [Oceanobacillus sp. Castelsardo]
MFISKKKLNRILQEAKSDSFREGYYEGKTEGYSNGHHVGLTTDKRGVIYTSNGLYVFDDTKNDEKVFHPLYASDFNVSTYKDN